MFNIGFPNSLMLFTLRIGCTSNHHDYRQIRRDLNADAEPAYESDRTAQKPSIFWLSLIAVSTAC